MSQDLTGLVDQIVCCYIRHYFSSFPSYRHSFHLLSSDTVAVAVSTSVRATASSLCSFSFVARKLDRKELVESVLYA